MNTDSYTYQTPFYVRFCYPERECPDDIWKITLPSAANKVSFLQALHLAFQSPVESDDPLQDFFIILDERLEQLHVKWGALIECLHMEDTVYVV